ncbi:hypothetical protein TWF694_003208 [Orbilia ellipsospora]|uniref:Uncharacterized protein n=1 Tax=Orbilia ellipsospora TaxID=2528407 RepID=A0AAV9X0X2_9PEZI
MLDPNVAIGVIFLCLGVVLLIVLNRTCFNRNRRERAKAALRGVPAPQRTPSFTDRIRNVNDPHLISPGQQLPGFRWRWAKKFEEKQDSIKEMLERKLKLLHVMATVKYQDKETNEVVDSWKEIATYMEGNPICTSVVPSEPPLIQRRLFLFDTLRYLHLNKTLIPGKRMQEWFGEFESVFLLGILKVDTWKVYLDNCRRLCLATPWLKVWNYRPREHLDFVFTPLKTPPPGNLGIMSRFIISFADITLVETTTPENDFNWIPWWWPFARPSRTPDWVDLAIDHKKDCKKAPPYVPSEQLLRESSNVSITRALMQKRVIVMDVCKPDDGHDMSFDITSSDLGVHLALLPLLHTPKHAAIPMELVVILFQKSMQSWKQFKEAFLEHVTSLKSHIYDNRAQKAMIETIMSSLKLTHSVGTISEHNIITLQKFLSEDTKTIDGNISAFWNWESQPTTLKEAFPEHAEELEKVMDFYTAMHGEVKEWDKELRSMMQMVFSLVSIDEAYRSREQAQSLKRLSWITFIFLPLMFVASLFGMNIDVLQNDPSWTWSLVVCAPAVAVVWVVWFAYRVKDRRREISEEHPFKSA